MRSHPVHLVKCSQPRFFAFAGRDGRPCPSTACAEKIASGPAIPNIRTMSAPDFMPQRKSLPHNIPAWVESGSMYFLTLCCKPRGHNQLCRPDVASRLFESASHRHGKGEWFVRLIVLMPDHLHALLSVQSEQALTKSIRLWKSFLARHVGIIWQRDFFEHRVRHDESWEAKADYMRANPVRAGLASDISNWPYVWTP